MTMQRTYVRRRRAALVISVGLVATLIFGLPAAGKALHHGARASVSPGRSIVVVQPGDTLWAIAERVAPDRDPRAVVDQLASVNRVDPGALVPGQALVLPSDG